MKTCPATTKFGRQRTACLDVINEEDGYDSDAKRAAADRSTLLSYLRRVQPTFLHPSGGGAFTDPHGKNRLVLQALDGVKQGMSIVLFELCRGVLLVVVLGSVATVAVCVGVYVHMNQWQLLV